MPIVVYNIPQSKNSGLPISASELASRYFFGIPIIDQAGNAMSEVDIEHHIQFAADEIEGYLNLKLSKQIVEETVPYSLNDFRSWGYIPTTYPVLKPHSLIGFLGRIEQVIYPPDWLSVKKTNQPYDMHRRVQLVPTAGASLSGQNTVVYSGISPHVGWFGNHNIPDYWKVTYCTSFVYIPSDILETIGKMAAINVFHQLGDIILGAGIASQSLGIDGLSQSISTTSSATSAGYGARILGYIDDLKRGLPKLKAKYDTINLMSM